MKCFPFLATVLDETWTRVPGDTDDEREAAVRAKEKYLHDAYPSLISRDKPISYKSAATRYAYMCCYVTSHANMVNHLIGNVSDLSNLFKRGNLKITCVGGGPGSDLLGVLKYVELLEKRKQAAGKPFSPINLKFYLYDGEQAWSEAWGDVDEKLGRAISTYFQLFDVTQPETYEEHTKYLDSDLFTMIYFASELYHCRDNAKKFFRQLFRRAKKDAMFLYIDNAVPAFSNWFDELYSAMGVDVVDSSDNVILSLPTSEDKEDLGDHYHRISGYPKLSGKVAYRVLRKK